MATAKPKTDPAVSVVERIDALCDRFKAAWKTGRRPDLAGYLEPTDGEPRAAAFAALLGVEIELRAKVVDRVFDELHSAPRRQFAILRLLGYRNREIADLHDCTERKVERKLNLIRVRWEAEWPGQDLG